LKFLKGTGPHKRIGFDVGNFNKHVMLHDRSALCQLLQIDPTGEKVSLKGIETRFIKYILAKPSRPYSEYKLKEFDEIIHYTASQEARKLVRQQTNNGTTRTFGLHAEKILKNIFQFYKNYFNRMVAVYIEGNPVVCTTDGYTGNHKKMYCTTVSFIDNDWEFNNVILGFYWVSSGVSHTASLLSEKLIEALHEVIDVSTQLKASYF